MTLVRCVKLPILLTVVGILRYVKEWEFAKAKPAILVMLPEIKTDTK